MKFRVLALALCLLLLSGCAGRFGTVVIATEKNGAPTEDAADGPQSGGQSKPEADSAALEEPSHSAEPSESAPEEFFGTLPRTYMFCSGAGGWSTELTLEPDGCFTGLFLDADMGVSDPEKFPGGTRYICRFHGKFTQPAKVDETAYSMELESLELEHPDDESEEYADGVRYIYAGPYGLEGAAAIMIYLPGALAESLPEGVLRAVKGPYDWEPTEAGTLGLTVLYNVSQEQGFVQYPLEMPDTEEGAP